MRKHAHDLPSQLNFTSVVLPNSGKPQLTVKFGNVTVTGDKPSLESVQESIAKSQNALKGLMTALAKPGIRLPEKKNVPQFWVDETDTSVLIRRLNRKTERGRFVEGQFEVLG